MKTRLLIPVLLVALSASAFGQMSSHAPTSVSARNSAPAELSPLTVSDKPVARVNGAVLTDRDLLREMLTIFPYAKQHNGFPKGQEASIRQGALEMIIFEELVYQEAVRRKIVIPAARLDRAESEFRQQFHSPDEYQQYLQAEMHGSEAAVRQQIKRSLLIEQVLKTDVGDKAAVSPLEMKAYYDKNPSKFEVPESFAFQSISVVPPLKPTPQQSQDARKKAEDALRQAKATKSYDDFGLLAEKISEDDYRVNMGDHKLVPKDKLPPEVIKALSSLKPGQMTGLIQIQSAYTILRLNVHNLARRVPLQEVKPELKVQLEKEKYERLRSNLAKQLRSKAKVEEVG